MVFLPMLFGIVLLVFLMTYVKLDSFISFVLACLFVGITSGLSVSESIQAIQVGVGNTLGSLVLILGFGAMLGKLVAESGGANAITDWLIQQFGLKRIQWAMMVTGFIVGIPIFYTVGFIILVPLAIAIAHKTKLSLLYIGLPMLASLSVTHGYLPPHPAPTALAEMYEADLGLTLLYGILVGIPAIIAAKYLLNSTMQRLQPKLIEDFIIETDENGMTPSIQTSLTIALLPVILIAGSSLLQSWIGSHWIISAIGNPAVAMLISVLVAIYFLGIRMGKTMQEISKMLGQSISSIAVVLLIIGGAGAFKQIMVATEISDQIGSALTSLGVSPILLAWLIATVIRVSVGSATVAGLTAGSIMAPVVQISTVSPELLVLATGAGSIMLSHVNDGGFWLFKEYFNLSIKETLMSWTLMETTVSIVGLLGVLILNQFV